MNPLDKIKELIEIALIESPTGDKFLDDRYDEQIGIIGHTNPYYKLFYLMAKEFKPKLTVELGTWRADGASHFAGGNPEGLVYCVDIHREDKDAQRRTVEAANHYPNLTYLNMWTWDAAEHIPQGIDCIFIDAWHDIKYVQQEWDLYFSLLAPQSIIIMDDITTAYNFEGMIEFWDNIKYPKFLDNQVHYPIPMGFVWIDNLFPKLDEFSKTEAFNSEVVEEIANKAEETIHVEQNRGLDQTQPATTHKRGRPRKESRA